MGTRNTLLPFSLGYGEPRTHYFSYDSKIPKIGHFGLTWEYLIMPKWLALTIGGQKKAISLNRTINTEEVNIWGPWFTKHEMEACL